MRKIPLPNNISLGFTLTLGIIAMGVVGISLALYVGETYRQVAIESQRVAYSDIVQLRADDLIEELKRYSLNLGHSMQNSAKLRNGLKINDKESVVKYLTGHFHQFFVTTGVLKLNSIIAHDPDFNIVGRAWDEDAEAKNIGGVSCEYLIQRARSRKGAQRLKSISELCMNEADPFLHVLLPVGGFKILGYLEIVTDPAHNLIAIEKDLGMPLKISLMNGEDKYFSKNWPKSETTTHAITAKYLFKNSLGQAAMWISVSKDIKDYERQLLGTRNTLTLTAAVITFLVAFLMLLFVNRTTLRPIKKLRVHLNNLHRDSSLLGELVDLEGNIEVKELASGFNDMTSKLKKLYDEIQQTNDDLKAEVKERIKAEEKLKSNQDHLEELVDIRTADLAIARDSALQANESKSQFLANMSHELRTPLNAIIGYSELMIEDTKTSKDEALRNDLQSVYKAGTHLLTLINDILDLSKIEAGRVGLLIGDFGVYPLMKEIAATMTPAVDKNGNQLVMDCPEDIGIMHGDGMKLRQSLLNLLSNAAKFTQKGTIKCTVARIIKSDIEHIKFTIEDSGIGISEEAKKTIFKPFNQADTSMTRKFGGTGLGLAITRNYCQMMGGEVVVGNKKDNGAVFIMTLPAEIVETELSSLEMAEGLYSTLRR